MAFYSNYVYIIRQHIASAVGDLIMGTADSGTQTTTVDTELGDPRWGDDYFNEHGYRQYIYEGTNVGEERFITDWDQSAFQLTNAPAFSSAIDNTSKYELHWKFTAREYLNAINLAIESIADRYLINAKDESTIKLTSTEDNLGNTVYTWEYALPTSCLYLYRVIPEHAVAGQKSEASGDGKFETNEAIDLRFWSIIKSYPPKLKIDEDKYNIDEDLYLRLEYQAAQPRVSTDTDVVYLPPDWLVAKAVTLLPADKIQASELQHAIGWARESLGRMREPRSYPHPLAKKVIE